jgi:fumarate reductase subunit C
MWWYNKYGLIYTYRDFRSICVISFIIRLCLVLISISEPDVTFLTSFHTQLNKVTVEGDYAVWNGP